MTTIDRLDGWKAVGVISEDQHAMLTGLVRRERFSVFVELSALLYLGVLSLVGGLIWTFREYVASLGDVAILSILARAPSALRTVIKPQAPDPPPSATNTTSALGRSSKTSSA